MALKLHTNCAETKYEPDCDDYDPRKSEYVTPATDDEIAQARSELLSRQVQSLERSIARRDKLESPFWFFARRRAHYKRTIGEMRKELQQGQAALPEPSGKVDDQSALSLGRVLDQVTLPALCGWHKAMCWNSIMKTLSKTLCFWRSSLHLHFSRSYSCVHAGCGREQDLNVTSQPDLALGTLVCRFCGCE
mmetsp:Transcript_66949/g.131964  ORF Transcript_66949/g.131964 Transcript_66949/m.131964 type:complete len:191 (+) Transcript_66949:66-638(+)